MIREFVSQHGRRILKYLVVFFVILLILQFTIPPFFTNSSGIPATDGAITVVTYNIGKTLDPDLGPQLSELNADIIALQEVMDDHDPHNVSDDLQKLAEELGLYLLELQSYAPYGLAFLSRFPIIASQLVELTDVRCTRPRAVLQIVVDTPEGRIQVLNTHFNTPNLYFTRNSQFTAILDEFDTSTKTVLMGDFNTPPYIVDLTYIRMTTNFEDSWVVAGNHPSSGKTYHSSVPLFRVDYIFVSTDLGVVEDSAQLIGSSSVSDHHGVMVDIVLTP